MSEMDAILPEAPHDRDYLGDGVYVGHDGYQIWLGTQYGNRIALEPSVMAALLRYAGRIAPGDSK